MSSFPLALVQKLSYLLQSEVFLEDIVELLLTLLGDKDTLCWGDTATTGQTVIQGDLRFLQLLLFTTLWREFNARQYVVLNKHNLISVYFSHFILYTQSHAV